MFCLSRWCERPALYPVTHCDAYSISYACHVLICSVKYSSRFMTVYSYVTCNFVRAWTIVH